MTNAAQSSRVAGSYNKSLFPQVSSGNLQTPSYFATKTITQTGENDIQIKEKQNANVLHYLVGASIIFGLIYYISKRWDS